MLGITTDTGIADLLLIYSVKSLLVEARPHLERLVLVHHDHPRLSFPTPLGPVVVEKSATTPAGIWTVSGPGAGIQTPAPRSSDLAAAALDACTPVVAAA